MTDHGSENTADCGGHCWWLWVQGLTGMWSSGCSSFPRLSGFPQGSATNGLDLTGQLHFILGILDVLDSRFAPWLQVPSAIQGGNPCS